MPVCFITGKIYRKQEYEIKTETDCKINYVDDFKHIKFGIVWYLCYHIYIIEEESTQKSVQDSVQDNGNSGGGMHFYGTSGAICTAAYGWTVWMDEEIKE